MPSELEHAVLGVVGLEEPCTAYEVRRVFQESPSSHWSGSGGAIYPLMRRLERQRLLRSAARRGDGRATRLFRLTEKGRRELRRWLLPPLPPGSSLMNVDPLRVRVRFLGALNGDERCAFVREARARLCEQLEAVQEKSQRDEVNGDIFGQLVNRGAVVSIRAQLSWLAELERAVQ